jgi:N-acetyl sugar amidotransferase
MEYKQCKKCVMDTTAKEFVETETGCNFCDQARKSLKDIEKEKSKLGDIVGEIWDQKGQYDCLIGLSGGVDSSFMLHKAVELGLSPIAYSVDNGWNDPKADENIMRLVETLKVPFYRYTIDIKKFAELQNAFIKSGTPNIEIPTDHILLATTYEMADKYGVKYILSGGNVATESIMPPSWGYNARDLVHIKDIYKRFTGKKLTGLPLISLLKWNWYKWVKRIKIVYLLDYLEYNRDEAIKILAEKYGYKDYGDKHQESEFTKWFQNFYLYKKFGFDKRLAHYSSMIVSGQMTREQAQERLLEQVYYPRFGIEEKVLKYPKHDYRDYRTDEKLFNFISKIIRKLKWKY